MKRTRLVLLILPGLALMAAGVATAYGKDSSVVFENPAHDFPQRIGYPRIGPDSLYAWIEGPVRGQTRRNEFPYRRAGSRAH